MSVLRVRLLRVRGKLDEDIPAPVFATSGSAGADLHAAVEHPVEIAPGERVAIPTGFALALPPGFEGQVRPRSGLALRHGIWLPNAPGTIDADYRGEVRVILANAGAKPYVVERGARVAQLVVAAVERPRFEVVSDERELGATERGRGGFGSTGE